MSKLAEPFSRQLKKQREGLEAAHLALDSCDEQTVGWRELESTISDEVVPTLEEWVSELKSLIQPFELGKLDYEKRRTEEFATRIRRHPRVLLRRLLNSILWIRINIRWIILLALTLSLLAILPLYWENLGVAINTLVAFIRTILGQ
jgi:hypothetical protein